MGRMKILFDIFETIFPNIAGDIVKVREHGLNSIYLIDSHRVIYLFIYEGETIWSLQKGVKINES